MQKISEKRARELSYQSPQDAPIEATIVDDVAAPTVLIYYRVYCLLMVVVYGLCTLAGLGMLVFIDQLNVQGPDRIAVRVQGIILSVLGVLLLGLFAYALSIPRKRTGWVVGMVAIGIGATSACCLPVVIPLLIFWVRSDTRRYFGY